ncbi:MAG: asparagine synthase (glutamine-hydrolyzing) [Bacteroidia bacterium]
MCGIAGIWHLNDSVLEENKLKKFTDSMHHRGPDGTGYYIDSQANLGLGHRRLSILDLSVSGKQPMNFADERYWITFNGEIYNFIELRNELKEKGYSFKTDTDTEVLLSAYHAWGKDCLHKFNGMWAFAIWDKQDRSLFLARDRFGVKPLHYIHIPSKIVAFASETLAFKHLDDYRRKIDPRLLQRTIIEPRRLEATGYTIFNEIQQLPAGCCMLIVKDKPIVQYRWWNTFDHTKKEAGNFNEQLEHFRFLFKDACKLRLRSDVPLASALSGGVDSSAVYCMINHLMNEQDVKLRTPKNWQKAFVATFPGTTQDERKFAEQVVNFTGGDAVYIESDYKNLPQEIISSTIKFDSITGTPIIAVSDVYKAMRNNGIIVSMDGHGADELMYGYRASVSEVYVEAILKNNAITEKDALEVYINLFLDEEKSKANERIKNKAQKIKLFENKQAAKNKFVKHVGKFVKNLLSNKNYISNLQKLNAGEWFNNSSLNVPEIISGSKMVFPELSRAELFLANDFHIEHIPYNLRDFDRASMQHGIEIRMPFMDYRLVSYLFSLPTESKIGAGYTKRILRESMKGLMPESIRTRRLKIGLSAPITNWFNNSLNEFILDQVNSTSFKTSPYWNGEIIKKFAEERTKNRSWNDTDSEKFWNVLNAHIIVSNEN